VFFFQAGWLLHKQGPRRARLRGAPGSFFLCAEEAAEEAYTEQGHARSRRPHPDSSASPTPYEYGPSAVLKGMWGNTHPGVVVSGHTISHGRCAVFGEGGIGQAELQAQTDPPKIGVLECASSRTSARSRTGELGTFLLLTTCEPYRVFNQRDSTWARVFFLARLGLKQIHCVIRERHEVQCRNQGYRNHR
jgi:hypothetical protein